VGRQAEGVPAAGRVVPSARWYRFAVVTIVLGMLTGFYGTFPAAFVLFHLGDVAAAAHRPAISDVLVWTAFGVLIAGASLTLYFTVWCAKRPSVATSAAGVTVFNWTTVTVPWDNIADVVLTPATRLTRRGWVPEIVQRDGRVLPVAFAEFLPSGGHAQGLVPEMPASGGVFEVSALIRGGLGAHSQAAAQAARTVPDLSTDPALAPVGGELLQPGPESARLERDWPPTVRHAATATGTSHTFCFHRGAHRAFGTLIAVFGVVWLAEAAATPITAGHLGGSWRDEIVVTGFGLLLVWLGIRAFRVGVHISGEKLTIRDEFRTRKVSAGEIRAITLQSKTMSAAGSHWVPRVDLIDGNGVWVTNFDCGPADRPPQPQLAATVDEVRELLGVSAAGTGAAESPPPEAAVE
jgi:hypothetical protein